jgi:hypothetical protein
MPRGGSETVGAKAKAIQRANATALKEGRIDDLVPPRTVDRNNSAQFQKWIARITKTNQKRKDSKTGKTGTFSVAKPKTTGGGGGGGRGLRGCQDVNYEEEEEGDEWEDEYVAGDDDFGEDEEDEGEDEVYTPAKVKSVVKTGSEVVATAGKVASRGLADSNRVNSAASAPQNQAAYVHPLTGINEDEIYALTPKQLAEVFLRGDKAFRDEFIRSIKVSILREMWIIKH